jgi:hypothetical protein
MSMDTRNSKNAINSREESNNRNANNTRNATIAGRPATIIPSGIIRTLPRAGMQAIAVTQATNNSKDDRTSMTSTEEMLETAGMKASTGPPTQ